MAIEFSVVVTNVANAGTKNVAVTLANHSRTIQVEITDFDNPPSAIEFLNAVTTLLKASFWAQTGTPAQRLAAVQAGITKLAYYNYRTDALVNP